MTRRSLLIPLIFSIVLSIVAVGGSLATDTKPILGLDLQGGFSVVLQAKEVNGQLPSEEAVEKAKEIMRQRVDGLGVAEPDITRQGRTVIVQLPGVKDREQAQCVVGNTAKLEFRPVLSVAANPDAPGAETPSSTTTVEGDPTTTVAGDTTTTAADGATTTVPADGSTTVPVRIDATTTTDVGGEGETGSGAVGIGLGEGALPAQFAPSTTTTLPPETTTTLPPETTTVPATTTTTLVDGATTTTTAVPGTSSGADACGDDEDGGAAAATTTTTATTLPGGGTPEDPAAPADQVTVPSEDGSVLYTLGPLGFSGEALSSANAALNGGAWTINVAVKGSAKTQANAAFNECYSGGATCPAQNQEGRGAIAIVLDGEVLSAPAVNGPDLASDNFTISGDFDEKDAKELALVLRYGSLPVEFEQAALQQVSATLGADSLQAGLIAGLVGVAALALYMILFYRGFGLVVVISLVVWSALMYGLVCLLSANQGLALTLAGITGIIVSIGTTVDTYVVVFERVKDEIREGRSVKIATERGFKSGMKTVYTANGAAFIGAFLLWILTVGPVRGFAYFLGLSVILDLLVATMFTRPLVMLLGRSPRFARAKFFGVGSSTDQHVPAAKGAAS